VPGLAAQPAKQHANQKRSVEPVGFGATTIPATPLSVPEWITWPSMLRARRHRGG
jgi:hypothetical protein